MKEERKTKLNSSQKKLNTGPMMNSSSIDKKSKERKDTLSDLPFANDDCTESSQISKYTPSHTHSSKGSSSSSILKSEPDWTVYHGCSMLSDSIKEAGAEAGAYAGAGIINKYDMIDSTNENSDIHNNGILNSRINLKSKFASGSGSSSRSKLAVTQRVKRLSEKSSSSARSRKKKSGDSDDDDDDEDDDDSNDDDDDNEGGDEGNRGRDTDNDDSHSEDEYIEKQSKGKNNKQTKERINKGGERDKKSKVEGVMDLCVDSDVDTGLTNRRLSNRIKTVKTKYTDSESEIDERSVSEDDLENLDDDDIEVEEKDDGEKDEVREGEEEDKRAEEDSGEEEEEEEEIVVITEKKSSKKVGNRTDNKNDTSEKKNFQKTKMTAPSNNSESNIEVLSPLINSRKRKSEEFSRRINNEKCFSKIDEIFEEKEWSPKIRRKSPVIRIDSLLALEKGLKIENEKKMMNSMSEKVRNNKRKNNSNNDKDNNSNEEDDDDDDDIFNLFDKLKGKNVKNKQQQKNRKSLPLPSTKPLIINIDSPLSLLLSAPPSALKFREKSNFSTENTENAKSTEKKNKTVIKKTIKNKISNSSASDNDNSYNNSNDDDDNNGNSNDNDDSRRHSNSNSNSNSNDGHSNSNINSNRNRNIKINSNNKSDNNSDNYDRSKINRKCSNENIVEIDLVGSSDQENENDNENDNESDDENESKKKRKEVDKRKKKKSPLVKNDKNKTNNSKNSKNNDDNEYDGSNDDDDSDNDICNDGSSNNKNNDTNSKNKTNIRASSRSRGTKVISYACPDSE